VFNFSCRKRDGADAAVPPAVDMILAAGADAGLTSSSREWKLARRTSLSGPQQAFKLQKGDSSFHICRRLAVGIAAALLPRLPAKARGTISSEVEIPLRWDAGGFYMWFSLDSASAQGQESAKNPHRIYAVADTGSPFLLVGKCLRPDCAAYCAEVGCFEGEGAPTGEADSMEGYASGLVEVAWRKSGRVTFPDANLGMSRNAVELNNIRFGVQGRVIGFGGTGKAVFFGLIRDHMSDIKTSFLEQTPFKSLVVDLRQPGQERLMLSETSSIPDTDGRPACIKLADPRRWGDPVKHYCAVVDMLRVGGRVVTSSSSSSPRKVLAIFDTGTTGVSMTPGLYQSYWSMAQTSAQEGVSWAKARKLEVRFTDTSGSNVSLDMYMGRHPSYGIGLDLVTPIDEMAWVGVGPPESIANYKVPGGVQDKQPFEDVMLLGLGFLVGRCISINTVADELTISC